MAKLVIATGPTGVAAIFTPPPAIMRGRDGQPRVRTIDGKPAVVIVEPAVWEEQIIPEVTQQVPTGTVDARGRAITRRVVVREEVRRHVEIQSAVTRLMTDEEYIAAQQLRGKVFPPGYTDPVVIDADDLPADLFAGDDRRGKLFRNAWRVQGGTLAVDMDAARTLHMDRIRAARAPVLAGLDVDYQRADESGDAVRKADVATAKQRLRDLPKAFDLTAAKTPRELAAMWPADLPPP